MQPMSESFVDLSYRGLALGKRIKLTQVRPGSGYLEIPTPMPVGTKIGMTTDDGVQLEAIVAEVHEQVGGSEQTPGMLVKPTLDVAAADAWWKARASGQDAKPDRATPAADDAGVVTVKSPRMTGELAVPELVDDGRDTGVMDAIDPEGEKSSAVETQIVDVPLDGLPRDTNPTMAAAPASGEEMSRTTAMDAVDLAALGLSTGSGEMKAVKPEDYADDDAAAGNGNGDAGDSKPDAPGGGKKKKRKRR